MTHPVFNSHHSETQMLRCAFHLFNGCFFVYVFCLYACVYMCVYM